MNYCPTCNETGKSQGHHRFVLEQPGERMLLVVGLNPSTADETHPDLTVRKVVGFAEGGGYDGFAMLNLSSERATDKRSLSATLDDAMYRKNLDVAADLLQRYPAADILVAFGNDISIRPYLKQSFRDLYSVLRASRGGAMVSNRETYGERKSPPSALCPIRLGISAVRGGKIYEKLK